MKTAYFLFFLMYISTSHCFAQCFTPNGISTSNINYYNAEVNWQTTLGSYFYRIRYKVIGASNWSFENNISYNSTTKLLTGLTPLSDYIWQIKSYCDSTNTLTSGWSAIDTFTTITNMCPNTNTLFTTNINHNNATANWDTISGANRYKIRYKAITTSLWSNLGPIYHPEDSITIPLLQQNTSYEWQILAFHDTSSLLASLWSVSDTFTTTSFVYTPFNPIVIIDLSNLECSSPAEFSLEITQSAYEPDISTSTITSDGGYFDIGSLNVGDSVGYAIITTASQSINTVLKTGVIVGQDYAIINSYDTAGVLVGFFTIENTNNGIKITTTTPNDNNDYTSGYISKVNFTRLFLNPTNPGPLYFFSDIKSELNDQTYITDNFQIWCNTVNITAQKFEKQIIGVYDVLGRKTSLESGVFFFIQLSNGKIERRVLLKE